VGVYISDKSSGLYGQLHALCQRLVENNPKVVADVQSGDERAVGELIGQARNENSNVDRGQVRQICLSLIDLME